MLKSLPCPQPAPACPGLDSLYRPRAAQVPELAKGNRSSLLSESFLPKGLEVKGHRGGGAVVSARQALTIELV